jgi:leucine dehydrogenase
MNVFREIDATGLSRFDAHEKCIAVENESCGLRAYIVIHNTNLGPALGGCRMYNYPGEEQALHDILRLSKGMTYKNALAGLPLGGGHVVIIGNPGVNKSADMFRALGQAIESLDGQLIVGGDSGIAPDDLSITGQETQHVVGLPVEETDGALGGNTAPYGARGVFYGMKRAARRRFGSESLKGKRIAVQGAGSVGLELCRLLAGDGAVLMACEPNAAARQRLADSVPGIPFIDVDHIFAAEADIFAPCAMGEQLNSSSIPQMHFQMIAGSANNQLHRRRHDVWMAERGILYVPEYVINSGGTIAAAYEHFQATGKTPPGWAMTSDALEKHIAGIPLTVDKVLDFAKESGLPAGHAASSVAETIFLGGTPQRNRGNQG